MNKCPNCGKNTITNFNKLKLGPVNSISCPNCKKELTVPMLSGLNNSIIIFTVIFCSLQFDMSFSSRVLLGIMGGLLQIYIHIKFIPLVLVEE